MHCKSKAIRLTNSGDKLCINLQSSARWVCLDAHEVKSKTKISDNYTDRNLRIVHDVLEEMQ